ncbi:hypothetical protein H1W00_14030 [Aeromicrobium sp. Marseille-Q0843]|uniref:Uncharacterized protein n=1 Tax=Aeromicrobium phoceense TaxID=2754045 RepID=A0A838XDR3_9ACTN|nr:hypothetical protein [Aeromicrobium phoceense]MBA4609599.1 hypothetical protein [Aeromicrobium phoceense]
MTTFPKSWCFGVGCLAFEYKERPIEFTLGEWAAEVRASLEKISTIDEIDIAVENSQARYKQKASLAEGEVATSSAGAFLTQRFIPQVVGQRISFEISITSRLHEQFIGARKLRAERFRVDVHYAYYGPVAFIACLEPKAARGAGSAAVVLVRKFLADALEKSDGNIRLSVLGPSPFHASFYALPAQVDGEETISRFTWEEGPRAGYRSAAIHYSDLPDASSIDVWKELQWVLADEFSAFYAVMQRRLRRMKNNSLVFQQTEELVAASTAGGFKGWFTRVFKTAARSRGLGLLAMQAQLMTISDDEFAQERLTALPRETRTLGIALEEIKQASTYAETDAVDSALAMVKFLESGRSRDFEVAVIAASTTLGAVAGALAAVIAG